MDNQILGQLQNEHLEIIFTKKSTISRFHKIDSHRLSLLQVVLCNACKKCLKVGLILDPPWETSYSHPTGLHCAPSGPLFTPFLKLFWHLVIPFKCSFGQNLTQSPSWAYLGTHRDYQSLCNCDPKKKVSSKNFNPRLDLFLPKNREKLLAEESKKNGETIIGKIFQPKKSLLLDSFERKISTLNLPPKPWLSGKSRCLHGKGTQVQHHVFLSLGIRWWGKN